VVTGVVTGGRRDRRPWPAHSSESTPSSKPTNHSFRWINWMDVQSPWPGANSDSIT